MSSLSPPLSDASPARRSRGQRLRGLLHRSEALRGYLLLSPALLVLGLAILVPMALLIAMSTWSMSGFDLVTTPGLGNYAAIAGDPIYSALLGRSLKVAAIATAVTVILSYPVAYYVAFHVHRHKMLWIILLTLPFWTSYLMRIFAWRVVLGYEGVINSALLSVGLIEAPLQVFLYSQTAVMSISANIFGYSSSSGPKL